MADVERGERRSSTCGSGGREAHTIALHAPVSAGEQGKGEAREDQGKEKGGGKRSGTRRHDGEELRWRLAAEDFPFLAGWTCASFFALNMHMAPSPTHGDIPPCLSHHSSCIYPSHPPGKAAKGPRFGGVVASSAAADTPPVHPSRAATRTQANG